MNSLNISTQYCEEEEGTDYSRVDVMVVLVVPFASRPPFRALPTETKVESGASQSKSGTSVNLSNSRESVNFGVRQSLGAAASEQRGLKKF